MAFSSCSLAVGPPTAVLGWVVEGSVGGLSGVDWKGVSLRRRGGPRGGGGRGVPGSGLDGGAGGGRGRYGRSLLHTAGGLIGGGDVSTSLLGGLDHNSLSR